MSREFVVRQQGEEVSEVIKAAYAFDAVVKFCQPRQYLMVGIDRNYGPTKEYQSCVRFVVRESGKNMRWIWVFKKW